MSDDLKTGACGMWRVIILAMAGLTAMVAHAQTPASDPKPPGYTVQQQGNITNILVDDPDLQKQAALFQAVRAQPATEDAVIVPIYEERRVGKECGITCRSRWWAYH